MRICLYQPDIPQNTGTILRMGACLGVAVDIIGPTGFVWSDTRLRRAGMDYLSHVDLHRHESWEAFRRDRGSGRLVLLTTKASLAFHHFAFATDDHLLVGRESAGVPDVVHDAADARLVVPMVAAVRSLNVAVAAALVLGEALRQCEGFP